MSFFHGINYLHKSALIFMTFLLSGFMLATGRVSALVSYQTVQKLGLLYAMLQICEFYRQRFYLNARQECGLHWRVALLQYAKWPYFLMAFLDVLFNKEKPYELTEKVKSTLPKRLLLWPHLLVIVFLAEPLFAEWVLEEPRSIPSCGSLYQCCLSHPEFSSGLIFGVFPHPSTGRYSVIRCYRNMKRVAIKIRNRYCRINKPSQRRCPSAHNSRPCVPCRHSMLKLTDLGDGALRPRRVYGGRVYWE